MASARNCPERNNPAVLPTLWKVTRGPFFIGKILLSSLISIYCGPRGQLASLFDLNVETNTARFVYLALLSALSTSRRSGILD